MSDPIYIIACSATKSRSLVNGIDLPAREAYAGQAFRFARDQVERKGARYFVLSAHYGLLNPDSIISNYNVKMTPLKPSDQWDEAFAMVTDDELALLKTAPRVVVLGSKLYADAASVLLGREVECPLAGLPIGRMLNALRVGMWDSLPSQWKEAA